MDSPQSFTIPSYVRVCVTMDGSVVLDLKRDRYVGLGKEATELLAAAITAWPKPRWDHPAALLNSPAAASKAWELAKSLVEDGLLMPEPTGRIRLEEQPSCDVTRQWISVGDELEVEFQVTLRKIANFANAFLWARGSLASRPLWGVVQTVQETKKRHDGAVDITYLPELVSLVCAFRQLRPFFFAAEGRCLLHALTLVRFLSLNGFYPEWVIGVATRPWAAHSWVQWGNFLLDTSPDKVCRYTPIMMV